MSTTQIPPGTPAQSTHSPQRPDGGDLYDAGRWELAYSEMHDAPALIVQLQDDLSRSRQREAFWISVVVHLTIIILFINFQKLQGLYGRAPVVAVSPNDVMRQKDLTYLELPPDEQQITKRPETDKISDKNRIATSRSPQLDREELKKILDAARPGAPGPGGAPQQQQQPTPPVAQNTPAPDTQQPQPSSMPPPPTQNQNARLQTPPAGVPNFGSQTMSPGSAIEQAARAAAANRAGYGGDNGDYGLGQGRQPAQAIGPLDILNDTMGVDFGPYLSRILHDVRENWYNLIPEAARSGFKKGKVTIEFFILKDGKVAGMAITGPSGDVSLDRAAYGGITSSSPFPPLPAEFGGQYLQLRFRFYYNPDKTDLQ